MFSSGSSQVSDPVYIENVFSTYLYTGNGSTLTITNGIDLSTRGGLVWSKSRNAAEWHSLCDTARGVSSQLHSNSTGTTSASGVTQFNSNGYATSGSQSNLGSTNYASWTFRKQPKFFDVVTYTGNAGNVSQAINHSLGATPGCIIVKSLTSTTANWLVWHRELTFGNSLNLNTTAAQDYSVSFFGNGTIPVNPTSTQFTVGDSSQINNVGHQYVAYLFAHNAGGFGLAGTDNVISCGTFTTDASGNFTAVNLGYEAQWVLYKRSNGIQSWYMGDVMRGMANGLGAEPPSAGTSQVLYPNTSGGEAAGVYVIPTATGFAPSYSGPLSASATYIYIAIRRGPMKVPTLGTTVYNAAFRNAAAGLPQFNSGFPTDFSITMDRDGSGNIDTVDRLRGTKRLRTYDTAAETTGSPNVLWDYMNGYGSTTGSSYDRQLAYLFRRAPGFFDVVCYTGNATARTINHNLGVIPELMIFKNRAEASTGWITALTVGGLSWTSGNFLRIELTNGTLTNTLVLDTTPTATLFSIPSTITLNYNAANYVAYLFATLAGVSKVGSYTGTGTTKQIDCGFTAGARFVLIKRTDLAGDWYVWDTARGIVAGNDPYLLLNSAAVEVTNTDYVDTYSAGFEISNTAPAGINASGGTYIFLAIA